MSRRRPGTTPSSLATGGQSAGAESPRLTLDSLREALQAADPSVLLVLPRILRRVIRVHRDCGGWGWNVPHRKSYVIDRGTLLAIVDPEELNLRGAADVPPQAVLLPEPTSEQLAGTPADEVLVEFWRLLFHAQVHVALERRIAEGCLDSAKLRRRMQQIGPTTLDEIRTVLQQENLLFPPGDDRTLYAEFTAVYLEMRYFAPSFLPRYFPAIEQPEKIDQILAQDVDAEEILRQSRPSGAPTPRDAMEPEDLNEWTALDELPAEEYRTFDSAHRPSERKYRRLVHRAEKAAGAGNLVRSAMLRVRAQPFAPRKSEASRELKEDLDGLAARLCAALEIDESNTIPWRAALASLARQASRAVWNAEARLLYDLQKVCVDFEREIHTVDLVEWMLSLGKRPIQRSLPHQRDVLMSKHLRSAARRLPAVRISDRQRQQLSALIRQGIERTEARIRERFRPVIAAVLDEVGLAPRNLPERVARNKLVEELLDRIVEYGYLTMGDFRDALSRNNLKLPDLQRPWPDESQESASGAASAFWQFLRRFAVWFGSLLRRDELLEADRRLAVSLDGVYHGGEIYLRAMQHMISLLFGTRTGRFITRYLAVPFAGAYVILAGADHLVEMVHGWFVEPPPGAAASAEQAAELAPYVAEAVHHPEIHLKTTLTVLLLGLLLVGLINSERFRNAVWQGLRTAFRALRTVLFDAPRWLLQRRWVKRILQSRPAVLAFRFGLKPAALTLLLWPLLTPPSRRWDIFGLRAAMLFLAINLLLNSRAGRRLEELAIDWTLQAWHRFGLRLFANLVSLVMELSKEALEAIERFLYTVDEWLRFKSGESRLTFWVKAVLGLGWFYVTYVVRFCINLLIEPQINPIKHFPVVTVSHKLLLPLIPHLAFVLEYTMERGLAWTIAGTVIFSIPGIFGFLVWELKENWRLYAANRSPNLGPVAIGSHGEAMPRLLKRGFHSGTLPKRFAKLRRAERRARRKGNWKAVRKQLHALHHVELAIRRFIERELLGVLEDCPAWRAGKVTLDELRVGPNLVRATLLCSEVETLSGAEPLILSMEVRAGWLLAGTVRPGWASRLEPSARTVLANAILKLYKTAGIDLVHQQLEVVLPTQLPYDVVERGLVVWPDPSMQCELLYDLHQEGGDLQPSVIAGEPAQTPPALPRSGVLFREVAISWDDWVRTWESPGGINASSDTVVPIRVLPLSAPPSDAPADSACATAGWPVRTHHAPP